MTRLFLVISLFWVFPSVCQTLDIPLQSALLIKGEPVGFSVPPIRQKRADTGNGTISCNEYEYKPRKRDYCCNKCMAGLKVKSDCLGKGQATQCVHCENGTYTELPNRSKSCEACKECLSQNGQIQLSPCTRGKDTVCGCPAGQFKTKPERNFKCQNCSKCVNGTELIKCDQDSDTICKCFHGFFFDDLNRQCLPCTECGHPECQDHCPQRIVSEPPKDHGALLVLMGTLLAVCVLGIVITITWKKRKKISSYLKKKTSSPSPVIEGIIVQSTPLMDNKMTPALNALTGHTGCTTDNLYVVQESTPQCTALPLPDITMQTTAPRLHSPEVLYEIIECVPFGRWREFVRRLGLSNRTIETAEHDNRHFSDAQYAMLGVWINRVGSSAATRDSLFRVLKDMDLGGCVERIEERL